MRQLRRISFFLYSGLLLVTGFYGHIKYEEFFYPGGLPGNAALTQEKEDATISVTAVPARISSDTALLTICYDTTTGETAEESEAMPEKYIGMEREEFLLCIQDEAQAPVLSERKKGLFDIQVQSFSAQRVVIRKSYRTWSATDAYFLALRENLVIIYEEDERTIYMQTGIDARTLPGEIRDGLSRGMRMEGDDAVQDFLAEYSPDSLAE